MRNKIKLISALLLFLVASAQSQSQTDLYGSLMAEKALISKIYDSINSINKSMLVSINSIAYSESGRLYKDISEKLNSLPDKPDSKRLTGFLAEVKTAHRAYINDSHARIKENLELIAEMKELYPDVYSANYCINTIPKYNSLLNEIQTFKTSGGDLYRIINLIIDADTTFASEVNIAN